MLLLVCACAAVSAEGMQFLANPSQQIKIPAECKNNSIFAANTKANISIKYPDLNYYVNNQPMTANGTGQFYYNFTAPTTTGVYNALITCAWTGTSVKAQESGTIQVKDFEGDTGMTAVATALFTIALCGLIIYGIMKAQPFIKRTSFRYATFIPLLLVLTVGMYYFYMVVKTTTYGGFTLSMLLITVTFLSVATIALGIYSLVLFIVEAVESINKKL